MAKDPAFLFYPGDWLGGTMTLTRHQKGCYMDLLMAQFNSGPLSLESIKTLLGQDQATWTVLQGKFKKTENGLYFNERMEAEKEKRVKHSIKQTENVKKRWDKYNGNTNVYTKHIPLEDVNENEIKDIEKGVQGEKLTKPEIHQQLKSDILSELIDHQGGQSQDCEAILRRLRYFAKYGSEKAAWTAFKNHFELCALAIGANQEFHTKRSALFRLEKFCRNVLENESKGHKPTEKKTVRQDQDYKY